LAGGITSFQFKKILADRQAVVKFYILTFGAITHTSDLHPFTCSSGIVEKERV